MTSDQDLARLSWLIPPPRCPAGLQSAGGHLKELQRALKNPAANMGMIVSEGVTRARRAVGLTGGVSLDEHVHPDLKPAAQLAGRVSEVVGRGTEGLGTWERRGGMRWLM